MYLRMDVNKADIFVPEIVHWVQVYGDEFEIRLKNEELNRNFMRYLRHMLQELFYKGKQHP